MWAIDKMDLIKLRLYRQHLKIMNGKPVKDLSILGRDLEKVIIVDTEPCNFRLQPNNGVFIKSWNGEQDDDELKRFKEIISSMEMSENITLKEVVDKLNSR
jgi:TFIIF-interacting CTD phosphatase-like protein